jgi:putative transposase
MFYMKRSKFIASQTMYAVNRFLAGIGVPDIYRELRLSTDTFYNWMAKYDGMMSRMKELEEDDRRKKMYLEE